MAKGKKTGGRKKGTPNKLTASLKEAIMNAFHGVGGEEYLQRVAETNQNAFCALLGKVLPTELSSAPGGFVVKVVTGVPDVRADD